MGRVCVIGAGIAGLTCAFELGRGGLEVDVFERSSRVGGRMGTRTRDGLAFDIGVNFLVRAYRGIHQLAEEVGVELRNASPVTHMTYHHGLERVVNFTTVRDVFRMEDLNLWTRLKFLRFVLRMRFEHPQLDFFDLSTLPPEINDTDAYTYTSQMISPEFADYVVDAFNGCMMFNRAHETSKAAFLSLFSMMADPSFDFSVLYPVGAMQTIPDRLARQLNVRHECEVSAVERLDAGWRVVAGDLSQEYQQVVVATTSGAAARLLPPGAAREVAQSTRYASTINLSYRVPLDVLGRTHCFYVPFLENPIISEFTNEAIKGEDTCRDGWSLVNVGLHEQAARELAGSSDEEVFYIVREQLLALNARLARVAERVVPYDLQRWPEAIPIYDCAQIDRMRTFLETEQGKDGLYLCGDYCNAPWTEGASRSGKIVAMSIIAGD